MARNEHTTAAPMPRAPRSPTSGSASTRSPRPCALALAVGLLAAAAALSAGCGAARAPEVRVLGVAQRAAIPPARREVVFVQVTNPASRPVRLTRLEYRFAAGAVTVARGELALARDVPAGAAIVVEVPLAGDRGAPLTLRGKLTAVIDRIARTFSVTAQVQP